MWTSRFRTILGTRNISTVTIRETKPIQHNNIVVRLGTKSNTGSTAIETPFHSLKSWKLPTVGIPGLVRPLHLENLAAPLNWGGAPRPDKTSYVASQLNKFYGKSIGPNTLVMYGRFHDHATAAARMLDPLFFELTDISRSRMMVLCSWIVYRRMVELVAEASVEVPKYVSSSPRRQVTDRSRLLGFLRVFFQWLWYQSKGIHGVDETIDEYQLRVWQEIDLLDSAYEDLRDNNNVDAMHAAIWAIVYPTHDIIDRTNLAACVDFIQLLRSDASKWTRLHIYRADFQLTAVPQFVPSFLQPLRWDTEGVQMSKALLNSLTKSPVLSKRPIV